MSGIQMSGIRIPQCISKHLFTGPRNGFGPVNREHSSSCSRSKVYLQPSLLQVCPALPRDALQTAGFESQLLQLFLQVHSPAPLKVNSAVDLGSNDQRKAGNV